MRDVVIVSACRTAIGAYGGTISSISATKLGSIVIAEAIKRAGIKKEDVEEVIMGQVLRHGCGQNPARISALEAGLPAEVCTNTINKVCGSGLMSVMFAASMIGNKDADIIVAGGMESMSRAPYMIENARFGYRMGHGKLIDSMIADGLWDVFNDFHMGNSNDLISVDYGISREEQDKFALTSYQRALKAIEEGKFKDEIVPIEVPQKKGELILFQKDECPRETSLEALSKLKPAFASDGFATAGNSSSISDGAGACVVMSAERAKALGLKPLCRIVAYGSAGIDPKYVLIAPINSIPKVLKKAGLKKEDIQLHEINEAFSGSTCAIIKVLELSTDNINVNGGAVALGHPIGASGIRILTTLIYELKRRNLKLGEASLCLGGGEGVTMVVENI